MKLKVLSTHFKLQLLLWAASVNIFQCYCLLPSITSDTQLIFHTRHVKKGLFEGYVLEHFFLWRWNTEHICQKRILRLTLGKPKGQRLSYGERWWEQFLLASCHLHAVVTKKWHSASCVFRFDPLHANRVGICKINIDFL